ncbi:MAG: flavodoxin family protein [Anaerolineae bacterium]|nr:flavodoxin family protein [Anaerolineae bacterium]
MNVLILYQSRGGHTRDTAEAIAQAARELNHKTVIKSVIEVQKADVETADVLFVGTWVQGFILFGVKPAGAELWVPALPSLKGKEVAVFCTYAFNPRSSLHKLSAMLTTHGATVLGEHAFHRSKPHDHVKPFVQTVLQAVRQ